MSPKSRAFAIYAVIFATKIFKNIHILNKKAVS